MGQQRLQNVEFVDWCITGLVIKPRTTDTTSDGLKLQCIAIATFPADTAVCYCFVSVGCQLWTAQQGINYANGQWYLAYSLEDCQTGCTMTPGCTGIDWVSTAPLGLQCWLSGSWSGAQGRQWDVTHYVYNPSCAGKFQHFDIS